MIIMNKKVRALCQSRGCNPDSCDNAECHGELTDEVNLANYANQNPMHGVNVPIPSAYTEKCIRLFEEGGSEPVIIERRPKVVIYCGVVRNWCRSMNDDPVFHQGEPIVAKECEGPEHCTDRNCYEMVVRHVELLFEEEVGEDG